MVLHLVLGAPGASRALDAGVARVDLTPPLSLKASLGGYGERRSRPATGVHDRVWVKALVLRDGREQRAIVTADLLALPPGFREAVAARLAADGWAADHLLLLASHSHTSLDLTALNPRNTFGIPELGIYQEKVAAWAVDRFAEAVRRAAASPGPVRAGTATRSLEGWNRNRRRGPEVDRDLTVVRLETAAAEPLAVLVHWTAHPTFMGPEHMEFSGDWPGHLQRALESLIGRGVVALFANGAEGDQSPTPRSEEAPAWEKAEAYGRELAIEAWRAWQGIRPRPDPAFGWKTLDLALPRRVAHPDFLETGGKEYGLTAANVGALLEALCPERTHSTAFRLGDLLFVGVPGELAAGLGLEAKAALRKRTGATQVVLGGLADEWISYMLTPGEYRKGGYEASVSFYGETLGPEMVRAVIAAGEAAW